jgi:hypothetical protein
MTRVGSQRHMKKKKNFISPFMPVLDVLCCVNLGAGEVLSVLMLAK